MSDQIKWDHQLVRKFSSKNHFKLLNQLRSEIKAYPIKRKRDNNKSKNELTTSSKSNGQESNISNPYKYSISQEKQLPNEYDSNTSNYSNQFLKSNQNEYNYFNNVNKDTKIFNNTQSSTSTKGFASNNDNAV